MIKVEFKIKIESCRRALVFNNDICYDIDSGGVFKGGNELMGVDSILNLYFIETEIYFHSKGKLFAIKGEELKQIISFRDKDNVRPVRTNYFLTLKRKSRRINTYELYDLKKEMIWVISGNYFIDIFDSYLVLREKFNESEFKIIELLTGIENWKYIAPDGHRIIGKPNFVDDHLVIILEDEKDQTQVVVLNKETGEQKWASPMKIRTPQIEKGKLYEFASNVFNESYLVELEIITGKLRTFNFETFGETSSGVLNTIFDGILFFSYLSNGCGIGIIDLETKNILHIEHLELDDGVHVGVPLVTLNEVGILDSNQILHLFTWNKDDYIA